MVVVKVGDDRGSADQPVTGEIELNARVGVSSEVVAHKPVPIVRKSADDSAKAHEGAVVDGTSEDGSESIRIERTGPTPRSASADAAADGQIAGLLRGGGADKFETEGRAAALFVQHRNARGADWADPMTPAGPEEGVDCVARDQSGGVLKMQVTQASQGSWSTLARSSVAAVTDPQLDAAVDELRAAIEHKKTRALRDVVLLLDATDTPWPALRAVVRRFRETEGIRASEVGFREVWVVGPADALIARLDTEVAD